MTDERASTRNLTIKIHAFVLHRMEAGEAAVIEAMLAAVQADLVQLDPFAGPKPPPRPLHVRHSGLAYYFRNEVEHDDVHRPADKALWCTPET